MAKLSTALSKLRLLGSKGTTGTQASFMELFEGDEAKIKTVWRRASRGKWDSTAWCRFQARPIRAKPTLWCSMYSAAWRSRRPNSANDLRILQSFKEMEEPFEAASNRLVRHAL